MSSLKIAFNQANVIWWLEIAFVHFGQSQPLEAEGHHLYQTGYHLINHHSS